MKILLISHSPNLYGAERSLLDLAEGLAHSHHSVSVLCPVPGLLSQALQRFKIPVFYIPLSGIGKGSFIEILTFIVFFPQNVLRLSRWMRKNKIQVVYNNTINSLYGVFAAKIAGIRSVWHIREVKPKRTFLRKIVGLGIKLMSSDAVFNSYATMKAFSNHHIPSSWHVVYNGVETKTYQKKKTDNEYFVMGYAGQMAEHKKPERFLYIFSQIKNKSIKLKGIMAGNGPMLSKIRTIAYDLGISDDIVFTGYLTDLDSFYTDIDVLILTSDHESFGRVLVEAMCHGRAVVAADVDGVPEVVEDGKTGHLVPAHDIAAYSKKVLELLNNPEHCQMMGYAGRRRFLERFCKSNYQQKLIRLLVNETG